MRPCELALRGFRSYRAEARFDWRGRRLVGIVGPIGAGKSSILDAIAFALYGKTPGVGRDTRSLIHQLCDECHVELVFEVDGQIWRAVRALRRRGQAGHQLEHLAADGADAPVLERVAGDRPMTARVEQLLGLDFDAFCRSVLLAQNRFAQLLRATPAERDRVLQGVFGYERVDALRQAARERIAGLAGQLDGLVRDRERIERAREALEGARTAEQRAGARARELEAATPRLERLDRERAEAEALGRELEAARTELRAIAAALPSHEEIAAAATAGRGADERLAAAERDLAAALADRDARRAELAQVEGRVGDPALLASFEELVRRHEEEAAALERAAAELQDAEASERAARDDERRAAEEVAGADRAVRGAEETDRAAQARLEEARAALERALHADMAATLRTSLAVGEPCPVCDRPVHELPPTRRAPKVDAARRALDRAQARAREAAEGLDGARSTHAAAIATLEAARRAHEEIRTRRTQLAATLEARRADHAATAAALAEHLGEGDPRALLGARIAELDAARARLDEATARLESALTARDEAARDAERARGAVVELASRLTHAWGRLGEDRRVPPEVDGLEAAFADVGEAIVVKADELAGRSAEAAALGRARREERAAALRALGLEPDADPAAELLAASRAHADALARLGELEAEVEAAGQLTEALERTERQLLVARTLEEDLRAGGFLTYLLATGRAELAAVGSHHLETLTDGAFRFTPEFRIEDLNAAGSVRAAESLSGGETFLASLALALGLAEIVARGGGRLDAFFLDEGFGSLDPEHIARAMDGIGRLVAGRADRLVVVVSHVEQMKQEIEDLIVLDKDDVTGDTRVIRGARLRDGTERPRPNV
jgi:exonuclease SbcC